MQTDNELMVHIARLIPVSAALERELSARTQRHEVAKGRFLHRAGSVCQRTYFVVGGLVRSYYCKGDKEVTDYFAGEGDWVTAASSFMRQEPDQTYLQALETSQLYSLTGQDLGYLFEHFPEMERFGRITVAQQFLAQSTRLTAMQFSSAKAKYTYFCAAHRSLLPRLPLGMVASYLGITQETLSRVRSAT